MATPVDVSSQISTELAGTGDELVQVGLVGLGIGVGVLVLRKGWRIAKGFF